MEHSLWAGHGRRSGAVVGTGVAFAEVVRLDSGSHTTQELPIDFVKIIG